MSAALALVPSPAPDETSDLAPVIVVAAVTDSCSFCDRPKAYTLVDVEAAGLAACRDHLVEAIEWVTA